MIDISEARVAASHGTPSRCSRPQSPAEPGISPGTLRFLSTRIGGNSWALSSGVFEAATTGDWSGVRPVTLELAPVLDCNFHCHGCSYQCPRQASRASRVPLGEFAVANGSTVATYDTVDMVLQRACDAGVLGVIWTGGGEPTVWRPLPKAIALADALGLDNGLYTNGAQLGCHPYLVDALLNLPLIFIRVSLNAVTTGVAEQFAGATRAHVAAQMRGLRALLKGRAQRQGRPTPLPSIQVSVIVDALNIGDLTEVCETVIRIYLESCEGVHGPDDYFLVRPLTVHSGSEYSLDDHGDLLIRRILDVVGQDGNYTTRIAEAGLKLCLGFGLDQLDRGEVPDYAEIRRREYAGRRKCLANGCFLTVGPDATAYLCCDRNCDRHWAIGNLREQSVAEIWSGEKRTALLQHVNSQRCGPLVCEATCRVPRLNRIFEAIRQGELSAAEFASIQRAAANDRRLLLS